jgi:probable HAF family extracellular repeat protein
MNTTREGGKVKLRTLIRTVARTLIIALTFSVLLGAEQPREQNTEKQTRYWIKDLGTLGGTFSFPGGVNDRGEVEGLSLLPGDVAYHAFFWQGGMKDLGTFGGENSFAQAHPNNRGQVGGAAETSATDPSGEDFCDFGTHLICLPFVWHRQVLTPLPTLGGNNGWGFGMNNRGELVGTAENTRPDPTCAPPQVFQFEPVMWKTSEIERVGFAGDSPAARIGERNEIQRLPTPEGDPDGFGTAINNRGQAVGASGNCINPIAHALLWEKKGAMTDLGNFGGTTNNVPYDINDWGQVVGVSNLAGDTISHAFLWQKGNMTDLGTLPGDLTSLAEGIDITGRVIGGSFDADGNSRAFLWKNGVMSDLNTLVLNDSPLFLLEATGTSSHYGYIVGLGFQLSSGEVHVFLAIPKEVERIHDSARLATSAATNESQKVSVPENIRSILQKRRITGRFTGRLTKRQ